MHVCNDRLLLGLNQTLVGTTNNIAECLNRLSSGFKVNSAKDAPANFAIITEMQTELNSLDVARDNIEQGMDVLSLSEENSKISSSVFLVSSSWWFSVLLQQHQSKQSYQTNLYI